MDKGFSALLVDLLQRGVNFVIYALPGNDKVSVLVDDNTSEILSSRKFSVVDWHGNRFEILDRRQNAAGKSSEIDKGLQHPVIPSRSTTSWEEYNRGLQQVIEQLHENQGKVVISRCVALNDDSITYDTVAAAVAEMFAAYTPTFRAVYFTPSSGAWCVCSPELLLKVDKSTGDFHTVALAGTRPRQEDADLEGVDLVQWDDKNIREHNFVVRHITSQLSQITDTIRVAQTETITTGKIQHLMTRIEGTLPVNETDVHTADDAISDKASGMGNVIKRTLSLLHPTPAICGYPVGWARKVIERTESHDRECYGGYFSLEDDSRYTAHVNLRCFAFSPRHCCFWGGGGILADSAPRKEWAEATAKINATAQFIYGVHE